MELIPANWLRCARTGAGKTADLVFWEKKGLYTELTAKEYAEIFVRYSPAGRDDIARREMLATI